MTGLTARVIASSGAHVTGLVNAEGCDIGVFVPRGAQDVTIEHAVITGARGHGILVEGARGVTISYNHVTVTAGDDAFQPILIPEDKAITLAGSSYSTISHNKVVGQYDGGISVVDDGVEDPAAMNPAPASPATHDEILFNVLARGNGGCGIVLAAYDAGEPVADNTVAHNTLSNVQPGAIVIGTASSGASAMDNSVAYNTVSVSGLPGVIVHSNAPDDQLSGTVITGNVLSANGPDPTQGLGVSTGIALIGDYDPIVSTSVNGNYVKGDMLAIWEARAKDTVQSRNILVDAPTGSKLVARVSAPTPTGSGTKPG
jgi:hypothetical protein